MSGVGTPRRDESSLGSEVKELFTHNGALRVAAHFLFDLSLKTRNCGISHNRSNACRCQRFADQVRKGLDSASISRELRRTDRAAQASLSRAYKRLEPRGYLKRSVHTNGWKLTLCGEKIALLEWHHERSRYPHIILET
jgi:hypothetical protein